MQRKCPSWWAVFGRCCWSCGTATSGMNASCYIWSLVQKCSNKCGSWTCFGHVETTLGSLGVQDVCLGVPSWLFPGPDRWNVVSLQALMLTFPSHPRPRAHSPRAPHILPSLGGLLLFVSPPTTRSEAQSHQPLQSKEGAKEVLRLRSPTWRDLFRARHMAWP